MSEHWFTFNFAYQGDGHGGSRPLASGLQRVTAAAAAVHVLGGWPAVLAADIDEAQRLGDAQAAAWASAPLQPPAIAARRSASKPTVDVPPASAGADAISSPASTECHMSASATAKAPSRGTRSKNTPPPPASNKAEESPAETVESLRSKVAAAEQKLERIDVWKREDIAEQSSVVEGLRQQLAAAEVAVMPLPAAMGLSFTEAEPLVAAIKTTGNHREKIDDLGLQQLSRSIRIHGLQQRVGLRSLGDGSYELIFGARRLAATKLAGLESIPAKVYARDLTAAQVEILRTIENFGRQDLTHVEKALAVARTIDAIETTSQPAVELVRRMAERNGTAIDSIDAAATWQAHGTVAFGGSDAAGASLLRAIHDAGGLHAYVGQQLGFSAKWIQDHAYVSKLGGDARQLLAASRISIAHARELAKLGDKEAADGVARLVAKDTTGLGGESVEDCRRMVIERLRSLKGVPWELAVAFGQGVKGCTGYACTACPFNSKADPDLFGGAIADEPEQGTCTNEACFKAKKEIAEKDLTKIVAKAKPKVEAGKIEATENGVREFVPLYIRASTAARKVKKETTPAAAGGKGGKQKDPPKDPVVAAKERFEKDREEWAKAAAVKVLKALDTPEQRLAYAVCMDSLRGLYRAEYGRYHYGADDDDKSRESRYQADLKKLDKELASKGLANFIQAVKSPTLAAIIAARGSDKPGEWELRNKDPRAILQMAEALKVELPAMPDRAAMIAAAQAKTDKKVAAANKTSVPVPVNEKPAPATKPAAKATKATASVDKPAAKRPAAREVKSEPPPATKAAPVAAAPASGRGTFKVGDEVLDVLSRATVDGNLLRLPPGQLERKLYERVNKALAAIGGKWKGGKTAAHVFESSPADALAKILGTGTATDPRKALGYFPTPPALADQLAKWADIRPGQNALEPSAGRGNIAHAILRAQPLVDLVCVEIDPANVAAMNNDSHLAASATIEAADFLTWSYPEDFDRIVANPPFGDGLDVDHVTRMVGLLAPGGRLVSVMAAGVMFRDDKKHAEFRALVKRMGGRFEQLPDNSFAESGTGVRTCVVIVDAPGGAA